MARYEITAPSGERFEIMAPDGASEQEVMSYAKQQFATMGGQQKQPEMSLGEVGADVAKSAGIGLAQGGIGLATLPGNLEALGRLGINAAAGVAGAKPPVSSETFLPTYSDWKGRIEEHTGEFYKPKSVAGEYARTFGEFAPLALGGGVGAGARAARVLIPGTVSETAGQATKGTAAEPYARAAGAIVGGFMPNAAARLVTPAPANQARQASVQQLQNEGVTSITAGQRTGDNLTRWLEDATAMVPGSGRRAVGMQDEAATQFTRAKLAQAGIQADRATPDVLNQAFGQIGQEYQQFARNVNLQPSQVFGRRMQNIAARYEQMLPDAQRVPYVRALADDLARSAQGGMSGQQYGAIQSALKTQIRSMRKSPQASPETVRALEDMSQMLDTWVMRSVPNAQRQAMRAAMRDRNQRYRNMTIIEDAAGRAGETAASGILTPKNMVSAIKKNDPKGYTRNRNNMAPGSRAGVEVLTPLRSSGTAERTMAQNVIAAPSTAWGAATGAIAGGGDPLLTLVGAVAPHVIKAATARSVMSRPGQAYFGNQRIPQNIEPVPLAQISPLAAALLEREPTPLRGGTGPRYDENGNLRR